MLKVDSFIFLITIIFLLDKVSSDISHLVPGLFHPVYQLYGPPPSIIPSTTQPAPFLPEIIVNRHVKPGYDYNVPPNYLPSAPPPTAPQLDLPSEIPPSEGYLPPDQKFEIIISQEDSNQGYDYNIPTAGPPLFPTTAPGADIPEQPEVPQNPEDGYNYESPIHEALLPIPPQNGYLPPNSFIRHAKDFDQFNVHGKIPIKLQLKDMKCLANQNGYFKSLLRIDSLIGSAPVVENELIDPRCDLRVIQSHVVISIPVEDFNRCGIRNCGEHLCLKIRFPLIKGMKTGSDSLLTLQCKVQERIVHKTHSFKMGISNDIQARKLGTFAQGGSQQPLRTHIELLKKLPNGLTKRLDENDAVQLGEELLLRAHVNPGDGWNFTKLSDVNLYRMAPSGEILNTANLITPSGCVNPTMKYICPSVPSYEPPLGHRLSFKAIMFQGMRSGEEIQMSMKISGCIERGDCYINSQTCGFGRVRRSSKDNTTKTEFSEISTITFRVILPDGEAKGSDDFEKIRGYCIIGGILTLVVILIFILALIHYKFKY